MISLVYVSRSLIDRRELPLVLDNIHTVATDRNSILGITGVLIAAPHHFAQLIEGPIDGVEAVMSSISADRRHTELRVVRKVQIAKESCFHWRMARFDRGNFGEAIIGPQLTAAHVGTEADANSQLDRLFELVLRSGQLA